MKRNAILDIIKGICLITVVATHYLWSDDERLMYLFPIWIDMAIPFCMLISGYLYAKSLQKKSISCVTQAYSLANSGIVERLIRYSVPFLIAFSVEVTAFEVFHLREFPSALTLLREFICGGYGGGSYYYPLLVQLVFLFPLIYFCIYRHKEKGLIVCCILNVVYELLQWAYCLGEGTYRLLIFRYILLISFGCYFGLGGKLRTSTALLMFSIGFLSAIFNAYVGITPFFITYWRTTSFLTAMYTVPIFFVVHKLDVHFKPLELIGKASYNIFLVQMVFYRFASHFIYELVPNRFIQFAICMLSCLTGGIVFYYVETPITNRCIEAYKKLVLRYKP